MSNSPGYKALLIRADARALVDEAKKIHAERTGVELNYSQFVAWLCKQYLGGKHETEGVENN